jgi:hypothetical protein
MATGAKCKCGEPEDGGEFGWFDADDGTFCNACGSEVRMNPATNGGTMETHEALAEAVKFLDDYSVDDFGTHEAFVAAAILWGERIGAQRIRETALQAVAEARDEILDLAALRS